MALSGKFTSVQRAIERAMREYDHAEFDINDAVEDIAEAVSLIGAPSAFDNKVCILEVEGYRAALPADLYLIELLRFPDSKVALRYDGDPFNTRHCDESLNIEAICEYTYTVNIGFIHTNYKEGELELAYMAYPTDDCGLPLIPDDDVAIKAVAYYAAAGAAARVYRRNPTNANQAVYFDLRQERDWYMARFSNKAILPSYGEEESIKNDYTRMIRNGVNYMNNFKDTGEKENLRKRFI